MMSSDDRSLSQRLLLGFGSIVLVLLATFFIVDREQRRSNAATERLERFVLPRSTLAWSLERNVLLIGIDLRSYLLGGSRHSRLALDAQIAETRRTLQALATMPKDPDGAALFMEIEPATIRYLAVTDSIAAERPEFNVAVEQRLLSARSQALSLVQRYSRLQQQKADTTLTVVAGVRQRVTRSVLGALLLCVTAALAAAVLTSRSIRRAADGLLGVARLFENGEWHSVARSVPGSARAATIPSSAVRPRNEFARVAAAFQVAGDAIEQREQELITRTDVAVAAASSLDAGAIARAILPLIAAHADAEVAVVHTKTGDESFDVLATHGIAHAHAVHGGEGIPGRAVREERTVVLEDIPADTPFRVRLGFDESPVRSVASVPLRTGGHTIGILTLGSLRTFPADTMQFLGAIALQVAVALQNARTFAEVQELLEEVSNQRAAILAQNERLQAQAEALQAQFEEIQAQSEEIQAQNEELQAQSEEIQAQNSELLETTQVLATADEQKNRFIALLGHELRNPLAAIANGVQLLSTVPDADHLTIRTRTMLDRQTRQLTRLVDDLLDVTRFAQGKVQLERTLVNFGDLVNDCVADHRARLDRQGVALQLVVPEVSVIVNGDRARLSQMVDNLLENAIKFTPGGGAISVTIAREANVVRFVVRDTGCGIDRALLPRLFEPFVQAEGPMQRSQSGLGLGLSLVRAQAELHGGKVVVESDGAGTGTTAILTLPGGDEELSRIPSVTSAEPLALSPRRVLIVEDNPDAASSLAELLRLDGHEVTVTTTVRTALDVARQQPPDFILCDIGLPDVDGCVFARQARAEPLLAGTWLVALTGYASPEDRERVMAAGFDQHLTKPASLECLRALARRTPLGSTARGTAVATPAERSLSDTALNDGSLN